MKILYEIYIEDKNKESFLVSKERLDFFNKKYSNVKIIREMKDYKFTRHERYFRDMPPAGCNAIIVKYNNSEYICRDYYTTWTRDTGQIWDIRTNEYYELREELERLRLENKCNDRDFNFYASIASRCDLDIEKLGDKRLRKIVNFFRNYNANVKKVLDKMDSCN